MKIFINDINRIRTRLGTTLTLLTVTLLSVFCAVYITNRQQIRGRIAAAGVLVPSTPYLSVENVEQAPPLSALVRQQYDAYVTKGKDGGYNIVSLKSKRFQNELRAVLKNPDAMPPSQSTQRGVGVNIVGFLMTFLAMVIFYCMFVLAEDKEQGQLGRIMASPYAFSRYLFAHCVFGLLPLLPVWLLIALLKAAGWNLGFSLPQYAGLLALYGLGCVAFSLLLNTLISKPDNANMLGNSVIVATTILSGCFFSLSTDSPFLDRIILALPQKQLLRLMLNLQAGKAFSDLFPLFYQILFAGVLFAVSAVLLRRRYVNRA